MEESAGISLNSFQSFDGDMTPEISSPSQQNVQQSWNESVILNPENSDSIRWSHQIPSVMPWSNQTEISNPDRKFSFNSTPPKAQNNSFVQNDFVCTSIENPAISSSLFCNQTISSTVFAQPNQSYHLANTNNLSMFPPSNMHNKRNFNHLMLGANNEEFDFDSNRPIKKYFGDEKILEIFDQFHIREDEPYIVEDISDINHEYQLRKLRNDKLKAIDEDGLRIEELETRINGIDDKPTLQFSIELNDVLKNRCNNTIPNSNCNVSERLFQNEKDKYLKQVVVWQPNTLTKLLDSKILTNPKNTDFESPEVDDADDDSTSSSLKIELASDDDENDDVVEIDKIEDDNNNYLDEMMDQEILMLN